MTSTIQMLTQGGLADATSAVRAVLSGIFSELPATGDKIIYVSPRGSDSNHGRSLARAKATVGAALTALGGGGTVQCGYGSITETVAWGSVPTGTHIRGMGKGLTTILHGFNGDLADLGSSVSLSELTIDGQGASYTGRCFYLPNNAGKQKVRDVALVNWDGYCLEFHEGGGSQFASSGLEVTRVNALTGTGRYAIKISDTQMLSAKPRSFVDLQTQGTCAIDFGGCNNVYVANSAVGDLRYTPDSRGVQVATTRILNQVALTVDGHNNGIVDCDINPGITLAASADNLSIGPNSYNTMPITDNTGNGRNNVTHWRTTYTPTIATTGGVTDLGNGTVSGFYSRAGDMITATVILTVGSTTTWGNTGHLVFSLPVAVPSVGTRVDHPGIGTIVQGSTTKFAVAEIYTGASFRLVDVLTGSLVTKTSPLTLADGDTIKVTITYNK